MMLYILFEIYRINFIIAFSWREFLENRTHILKMLIDIRYLSMDGFIHVQVHAYMHTRSFHRMYAMHPHIILLFVSQYKLLNLKTKNQ